MTPEPIATYRLQLRNGFGFAEAAAVVPYLARLGISHLYLAPIFEARAGSTHGYDITDPNLIDESLGGELGFAALCTCVRRHGMGILLDIVPNHQGIGPGNPMWWDLLRHGPDSPAAQLFDVDWSASAGGVPGRILLPVLGRPLAEVLEAGELTVEHGPEPCLRYFDARFPLALGTESEPDLARLLAAQHWRLAWWRCGNALLNWRRFFDITELAGVRVEDPSVFELTHRTILRLVADGSVQGLRVDHVDGLAEPGGYLRRLDCAWRRCSTAPPWILVEKILGEGEDLQDNWPVAGTTGYELLNVILGVFVDPDGLRRLGVTYRRFGGEPQGFAEIVSTSKREVLENNLAAELVRLERRILAEDLADVPPAELHEALIRTIQSFPFYRTYGAGGAFGPDDRLRLAQAWAGAIAAGAEPRAVAALERSLRPGTASLQAFEQLAGPAMAKALEDTAFYRWTLLVALNEVGGKPGRPASVDELHRTLVARAERWPLALTATASHDTKRGEDTRLRIALLSHIPERWNEEAGGWNEVADVADPGGLVGPDTRYLLFQTLVGVWSDGGAERADLADRLCAYMTKALREAKQRTSWLAPDEPFEAAVHRLIHSLLADSRFVARLARFTGAMAPAAALLGLAQTVIKLTAPGLPDIYQGTERWDLSLVDPDNRRPIDFRALAEPLDRWPVDYCDGRVKQLVIARLLAHRRAAGDLYRRGAYLPLTLEHTSAGRWLAYARRLDTQWSAVIVPLRGVPADAGLPEVELPGGLGSGAVREVISGRLTDGKGRVGGNPPDPGQLAIGVWTSVAA